MKSKIKRLQSNGESIETKIEKIQSNELDKIFYNLTLVNNTTSNQSLIFEKNINQFFLSEKPSNYSLGIVRFDIPLFDVPLYEFIPNSDIITLSYLGFSVSEPVTFITRNPISTNTYVYQISQFCEMVNKTINAAFTTLSGLVALPTINPPILTYDKELAIFTIKAEQAFYEDILVNPIKLYFNRSLFTKLSSIDSIAVGISNSEFQVLFHNNLDNIIGGYIYNTQEEFNFSLFSSFIGIEITSNVPTQMEFSDLGVGQNVLTDFLPLEMTIKNFRGSLIYSAIVPYRQAKINTDIEFNSFQLFIYRMDTKGTRTLMRIPPGSHSEIKIMFQRIETAKY